VSELRDFFTANISAAASLLGLLFVAVSISPARVFGADADGERKIQAERAFTALCNVLFVSLAGALPGSITHTIEIIALLSIVQTIRVGILTYRQHPGLQVWRHLGILSLCGYAFELVTAVRVAARSDAGGSLVFVVFVLYAYALGASWQVLGGRAKPQK
jgi:hypothetical protein